MTKSQATTSPLQVTRRYAPLNPNCVVCGVHNPRGLHIEFRTERDGVSADWVPGKEWESFQGTVHGGIITAVLDEAMSKAVIACDWEALTADLRVRFRERVSPGEKLTIRAWVVNRRRRRILTEGTLASDTDVERVHAWATFLVPRN
jgi:acyl-coenzyme A thioesterase PaaI-like protein